MSSYEDVYGMATSIIEALKNIQWKAPGQWELDSIIEPIQEQVILKLSKSQNLAANPTLAAPTNIRLFFNNIQTSMEDPTQLCIFITFLIVIPLFSTFFVAMLTNVNIVLKVLGLPLARNPVKASPLTVILFMITVFGNLPFVSFFPQRAAQVQALLLVQPGHYNGVIAQVLQAVAIYEQIELAVRVLLQMILLYRYGRIQIKRLLQPASIVAWLLTFSGFALRMWFTRVSTDTATSPVQSGSTVWVWRNSVLRTDFSYQSSDEFKDDVFIWVAYFVITFCASSLLIQYTLAPRHEVYQAVEPTFIKVTTSSSIETANVGCQTIVSGDDWVTKSSIAIDAEKVDEIQGVIDSDMKRASWFSRAWCNEAYWAAKDLKKITLLWQNDHTALQTHVALLKSFRVLVEHHDEESRKQRQHAEEVATNVIHLEEKVAERDREYEEMTKLREKEYQERLDGILRKVDSLGKGIDAPVAALDDINKQQASQPDASLGPRETGNQSVSANTPELQNTSEGSATLQCDTKPDTKDATEPTPLSPPSCAGDSSPSSGTSNGDKNIVSVVEKVDASSTNLVSSDRPVPLAATVSSSAGPSVEPEKASDSEMDAANASGGSDDEIIEEIGTGLWSRVQKFKFRSETFGSRLKTFVGRHFTIQEIQTITALLIDFRDNVANDTQREQVSIIIKAGFPYRAGLRYELGIDYLSVLLDIAELHKKPAREKLITEIPPMATSIVCGVAPHGISMINGHGKSWSAYRTRTLVPCLESHIRALPEDGQAYVRKIGTTVVNNIDRFLGGRPEFLNRVAPVQTLKADQTWDVNLILRRYLENFGIIEFRLDTTEGTSAEEYIPPALLEPAPVKPITTETPSVETPSVEVPAAVEDGKTPPVEIPSVEVPAAVEDGKTPSVEIPSTEPAVTAPADNNAFSTNAPANEVSLIVPTCGELPSPEASSQEVPISTCSDTPTTEVAHEVPPAVSPLVEKSSIEVPSAELVVAVPTCDQMPSVEATSSELSDILHNPTSAEALTIVVPDEPAQLQPAHTKELQQLPLEATAVPSDSSISPCIESPSEDSPPVSQAQPLLASSASPSPSTNTPTRPTPSKSAAPDWRQEVLQDMALQQQPQRPIAPLPQRNGRKSRGGRGRPRNSNA